MLRRNSSSNILSALTSATKQEDANNATQNPSTPELERHIRYFDIKSDNPEDANQLNFSSTREKLKGLGMSEVETDVLTSAIIAGTALKERRCPFFAKVSNTNVADDLHHARDLGMYNVEDNRFNEKKFEALVEACAEFDGKIQVIPKDRFFVYLNECHAEDTRPDPAGLGEKASDGEWGAYFNMLTDHWQQKNGDYMACVTVDALKAFLVNSGPMFDKVANHTLPVPRPR